MRHTVYATRAKGEDAPESEREDGPPSIRAMLIQISSIHICKPTNALSPLHLSKNPNGPPSRHSLLQTDCACYYSFVLFHLAYFTCGFVNNVKMYNSAVFTFYNAYAYFIDWRYRSHLLIKI